jgi:hypothetical protein
MLLLTLPGFRAIGKGTCVTSKVSSQSIASLILLVDSKGNLYLITGIRAIGVDEDRPAALIHIHQA